ncbi:MAG: DNA-binding protein [Clostridia bacterium]|nr:DNA-binding protein [Clostridia bacterium]MBR4014004.1 DNA-binding protein [Clostridia bacterium]
MFEKNLNIGYLLDFYGVLLSDRKRSVMDMYYNEDLSLAEVAEEIGISRQGVRDIIKKSEEELLFYEERLGLAEKLQRVEAETSELCRIADSEKLPSEIHERIVKLSELVRQ